MRRLGHTLTSLTESSDDLKGILRSDLSTGDVVVAKTLNSVYSFRVLEDQTFEVSGGWFDQNGRSALHTTIVGCTWGGCVLKRDAVAICGMCLEFGNRVTTSTIRSVALLRYGTLN